MKIVRYTDRDYASQIDALLGASSLFDPTIEQQTRAIVEAVRERHDAALLELTERFNGVKLHHEQIAVTQAEFMTAAIQADEGLRKAVAEAQKNVESFAKKSLRKNWSARNLHGAKVGEKFDPLTRVGVYIPGGHAPLVSTALMTIPLARVAGCREIVVCTPCNNKGQVNPALLYAARVAGATEVYRVGGAQAIAAMALGTETIRPVQKIFGPGNAYVVAAKRLLFGYVNVDLLPGPSELLVLADDTANPAYIAADMLAQAEHGSGHERVWFATPSAKLIRAVEKEINKQAGKAERGDAIKRVLDTNGWLIQVKDIEGGIDLANRIAPEHFEVMVRRPEKVVSNVVTAGAIFIGNETPTVLGDYVAGP
ncbi:MAG: Histidinol dehydrogenase, partial [Verrucomicrobiales bacterium]|nr:Histidinol dehydrogenase [Verrucomicrobiales bacterium]